MMKRALIASVVLVAAFFIASQSFAQGTCFYCASGPNPGGSCRTVGPDGPPGSPPYGYFCEYDETFHCFVYDRCIPIYQLTQSADTASSTELRRFELAGASLRVGGTGKVFLRTDDGTSVRVSQRGDGSWQILTCGGELMPVEAYLEDRRAGPRARLGLTGATALAAQLQYLSDVLAVSRGVDVGY